MPIAKPIINNAGVLTEAPASTALDYMRIGAAAFAASLSINTDDNDIVAVTLTGNVTTLTLTGTRARFTLRVRQDATGGRTITPSGSITFNGGVAAIVLDPSANAHTIVTFLYDPTTSKFDVVAASFGDTVAVVEGGTGATTAAGARTNLGLGTTSDVTFNSLTTTAALAVAVTANTGTNYALNLANAEYFKLTLTGNCTFTVSNVPATANRAYSFVVRLAQDATGSRTVTWFSGIRWPAATTPTQTATASRYDVYVFTTDDAGTSWTGTVAGQNFTV